MGLLALTASGTLITGTGTGASSVSISNVATAATIDSLCRIVASNLPGNASNPFPLWGIDKDGTFTTGNIKLQCVIENNGSGSVRARLQVPGVGQWQTNYIATASWPTTALIRALYHNGTQIVSIYDGVSGTQIDDTTTGVTAQFDGALNTAGGFGVVTLNLNALAASSSQTYDGLALYSASLGTLTAPYTHVPVSGDSNIVLGEHFPNSGSSPFAEFVGGGSMTATSGQYTLSSGGVWNPPPAGFGPRYWRGNKGMSAAVRHSYYT